jgi:class 3 adenylate cyclase/tetratricopeptide (TPR) repeat protein
VTFNEVLSQTLAMLHEHGRVSYRALKRQFALDEDYLEDLKDALLYAYPQVVDDGRGLVWPGDTAPSPALQPPAQPTAQAATPPAPAPPEAERRQLTVLFCDLVDSTRLASQLDPEDLREVVRAYQDTCAKVIARFEGHIAQYLGDGLLVYFGYPLAHEDDAQRAVRTGLGIVEAMGQLTMRLVQERGVHLAVRLGSHTGLVVVGDVGGRTRQEQLALGETPNLAARLQGLAAPNTLVISAATLQLLGGFFACQSLGAPPLKGLTQPVEVYQVLYESTARSRLEAAGSTGLTPLVGREQEVGLLQERWVQVKDGLGQVVLLSGEAGIGKSRLVQVLTAQVATEPQAWLTPCQCLPYHQHSVLYPMIDLLERVALRFDREESPQHKLRKLEGFLVMTSCFYNMGQSENAVRTGQRALTMALSLEDVALQIQAAYYLGLAYHLLGHYQQAVEILGRNVAAFEGELVHERLGLPYLPSVFSQTWLVWCCAELGAFDEGRAIGQEAIRIAEASEQPWDLLAAYRGVGLLALGQGNIQVAIPCFERCLGLCQKWDIAGWFAIMAAQLGYTYALSGRMREALPLLEEAIGQAPAKRSVYHARLLGYLSEAYLLDGRPADALPLAVSALEIASSRQERGFQAYSLHLVGESAAQHERPNVDEVKANYYQALALAEELGMRPLQAHCHRSLGTLYGIAGQREQAHAELSTVIEMYQTMEMTFWLPQAEMALAQVAPR